MKQKKHSKRDQTPQTIKPGGKRLGKFFAMVAFSLVWNGIMVFPIYFSIKSWQDGTPDVFISFMAILLGPAGLLMIGLMFLRLFAIFNPRHTLTLTPGTITLGEPTNLNWQINGKAHRLSRFTIYLVGLEEAEFERGTDTVSVTKVFFEKVLIDIQDLKKESTGSLEIDLPANSGKLMPSWESTHNRIKWALYVRSKMSRCPSVTDKYFITINPVATGI